MAGACCMVHKRAGVAGAWFIRIAQINEQLQTQVKNVDVRICLVISA